MMTEKPLSETQQWVNWFRDIPEVLQYHYKQGNMSSSMILKMVLMHTLAARGVLKAFECSSETRLLASILSVLSGFGITVGVHRLWSHRSYEAHWSLRFVLMLLNSIANQGTIYHWARDHRVHHKHSETNGDPHDATRGFFFAHMGWLCLKKHENVVKAGRELDLSDLTADPVVAFQMKCDPFLSLYMCFVFPVQIAVRFWGEDVWTAFYVAGVLRYCVALHITFLVNSAAHIYGDHPYDENSKAAENPIVSLCTIGEGWHNWHHKYPFDYAASEFGISSQFNLSKLFIDLCASVGLVWNRKRATSAWAKRRVRLTKGK